MIGAPVILIGGGGHARVLIELLRRLDAEIAGIVEADPSRHGTVLDDIPILGGDQMVLEHDPGEILLANGVGSVRQPEARRDVYERFSARGYRFATLVHPSSILADGIRPDAGAQIMAGTVIQPGTRIGANAIINTGATVDHDCTIGDHAHLSPGVTLSGNVVVGVASHVGAGATIIHGIIVGAGSLVAAGAVVTEDVPDNVAVAGVPARAA